MSFSNEIKTILKLDDKDWKKALKSVNQVEKQYYNETKSNTEKIIKLREVQSQRESKRAKSLELINKDIIKFEKQKRSALESNDKASEKRAQEELSRLKKIKTATNSLHTVKIQRTKESINAINRMNTVQKEQLKLMKLRESRLNGVVAKQKGLNAATKAGSTGLVTHIRRLESFLVAGYALIKMYDFTIGKGIEVNKMMESNTFGIAALISANTKMEDSLGNVLSPMDKFVAGSKLAKGVLKDIRLESLKMPATFKELTEIYQQATGQTLSMGDAFGTSVDSINKNTIKLSSRMSIIASSIGQPMDRVREEIRSMLTGNVSTDSIISTMLFGSPGQANQAIKKAKESTNGLTKLLDGIMQPFDVLADQKSFEKSVLQMKGAWEIAMSDMVQKSGLFQDLTDAFYETAQTIAANSDDIVESFDKVYKEVKRLADVFYEPLGVVAAIWATKVAWQALSATIAANPIGAVVVGTVAASEAMKQYVESVRLGGKTQAEFNKIQQETLDKYNSPEATQRRIELSKKETEQRISGLNTTISILRDLNRPYNEQEKALQNLTKELEGYEAGLKSIDKFTSSAKQLEDAKKLGELQLRLNLDKKLHAEVEREINRGQEKTLKLSNKILANNKEIAKIKPELKRETLPDTQRLDLEEKISNLKTANILNVKNINKIESKSSQDRLRKQLNLNKIQQEMLNNERIINGESISRLDILAQELNSAGLLLGSGQDRLANEKLFTEYQKQQIALKKEQSKIASEDIQLGLDIESDLDKILAEMDIKPIELKFTGFDKLTENLADGLNGIQDLSKASKKYNDIQEDTTKTEEEKTKASKEYAMTTVKGYGNMAGTIGSFYDEQSTQAKSLAKVEQALHLARMGMMLAEMMSKGTLAVLNQGNGDPYTAFARMAAMAAIVASMGVVIGGAISGGDKVSTTSDAFSTQSDNTGAGSILGDIEETSESITNSLDVLEDFASPQFRILNEMNKNLTSINEKIGGVSSLLIQQGGFGFGEGFQGFNSTSQNIKAQELGLAPGKAIDDIVNSIPILGSINKLAGSFLNSVLGGLFGKTSVNQSLTNYGINFNDALLDEAIKQIDGQAFQTITTTIHKKSWFSSSTSRSVRTYFQGLDDEIERQFSLVLGNLYDTTLLAGQALDTSSADIESSLSSFIVKIGKISTKGKTGEEIQEQISNIFSKIGDDIAKTAFPELNEFQQIGEGMFTTLTRVATGMEEAEYFIKRLGYAFDDIEYTDIINKQGDVALEALTQSLVKFDEAAFGVNNGVVQMVESFNGSAEDLFETYQKFEDIRSKLSLTGKDSSFLTSSMLLGAGGVDNLSDSIQNFFENFMTEEEQLAFNTQEMQKQFEKLNLSMPSSIDGFKSLISGIDISTEEGQELYGRVILLSDGFSTLAEDMGISMKDMENSLKSFNQAVISTSDSLQKTIDLLKKGDMTEEESLRSQKIEFNKISAEIKSYTDSTGNLLPQFEDDYTQRVGVIESLSKSIAGTNLLGEDEKTRLTSSIINQLENIKSISDITKETLSVYVVNKSLEVTAANSLPQYLESSGFTPVNIPSFDVGTTNVTSDMIAQIHKNEAIVPASFNQGIQKGELSLGNPKEIVGAILSTSEQLNKVLGTLNEIKQNTKRINADTELIKVIKLEEQA